MIRAWMVVMVLLMGASLMPGCAGSGAWTPNGKLAAARESFNGTVNTLAALRAQGAFTAADAEVVTMTMEAGQQALDRWQAALELGQEPAPAIEDFNAILRELVAQRLAAERHGGAQ